MSASYSPLVQAWERNANGCRSPSAGGSDPEFRPGGRAPLAGTMDEVSSQGTRFGFADAAAITGTEENLLNLCGLAVELELSDFLGSAPVHCAELSVVVRLV